MWCNLLNHVSHYSWCKCINDSRRPLFDGGPKMHTYNSWCSCLKCLSKCHGRWHFWVLILFLKDSFSVSLVRTTVLCGQVKPISQPILWVEKAVHHWPDLGFLAAEEVHSSGFLSFNGPITNSQTISESSWWVFLKWNWSWTSSSSW